MRHCVVRKEFLWLWRGSIRKYLGDEGRVLYHDSDSSHMNPYMINIIELYTKTCKKWTHVKSSKTSVKAMLIVLHWATQFKREGESWLKTQHSKNKDRGIWSHHFMANRWGNSGNSDRLYFLGLQKSLQMVTAAMKLKDTCSLEEKLWQN